MVAALAARRVKVRGLAPYRLSPRADDPALVLGYGRLPAAATAAAVAAIGEALDDVRGG